MRFRPFLPWGICLASCIAIVAVQAQNSPKTSSPAKKQLSEKPQDGEVLVTGDNVVSDDATGISTLTGKVTVTQVGEDFILYAQKLVYDSRKNRASASGNLRIETRDSTIRGVRVDANFDTKILSLTGNVAVSSHGKGDGITGNRKTEGVRDDLSRKASKLTCNRVDWDYETREAVLWGNLRMVQGKSSGTCDRILYDEGQNVAQLLGNVRFTDEKGQVFNTPDLTVYIDEDRMETKRARIQIKPNRGTETAPRPSKPAVRPKKAPQITDEDLKVFDFTPAPPPPPRPEVDIEAPPVAAPEPEAAPEQPTEKEERP